MSRVSRSLQPVPLRDVAIDDAFWAPRRDINRRTTILHEYRMLVETGRLEQYKLDWQPGMPNEPHIFWDSDVAKWIEAAAYDLATRNNPKLDRLLDEVIGLMAAAQQPDGYLNPHYTVVEPGNRWKNLRDCHEMYCAGHLIEAGVAHYQATGKRSLLDVVCRFADCIDNTFGPGKRAGYCGHEEIELALMKLYHATCEPRYLRLAGYFINERGSQPHVFDEEAVARGEKPKDFWAGDYRYNQAHKPVREQAEAVGHAVRAMYLYCGMADVARETNDGELLAACRRLWNDVVSRKMYITGGVGSRHQGEAFADAYDLPNGSAYAETCAAIGLVFFAHRMLQIERDGQYADVMEQALYNGVLSGVGLDGMKFFYVNPLASQGDHHRQPWFSCSCCPPNAARLLASLGHYAYSADDEALYVHLYIAGQAKAQLDGQTVTLTQEGNYPWNGRIRFTLDLPQAAKFSLMLRLPAWCHKHNVKINGKAIATKTTKGYIKLSRQWRSGDRVEISLDMPVERMAAHPRVEQDTGSVALIRGPIVYCLEQCDHTADIRLIRLPNRATLKTRFDSKLLGGVTRIEGVALEEMPSPWRGHLYQPVDERKMRTTKIRAIPYCLWDNRKPGAMVVWLPQV
jgi:hypothetical protein